MSNLTPQIQKPLDQLCDAIRLKHYSYSTEKIYVHWTRRYILFHNKGQLAEMSVVELETGYDIRVVQELLGRKDVKTTMTNTYVPTTYPRQ